MVRVAIDPMVVVAIELAEEGIAIGVPAIERPVRVVVVPEIGVVGIADDQIVALPDAPPVLSFTDTVLGIGRAMARAVTGRIAVRRRRVARIAHELVPDREKVGRSHQHHVAGTAVNGPVVNRSFDLLRLVPTRVVRDDVVQSDVLRAHACSALVICQVCGHGDPVRVLLRRGSRQLVGNDDEELSEKQIPGVVGIEKLAWPGDGHGAGRQRGIAIRSGAPPGDEKQEPCQGIGAEWVRALQ